MSTNPFQNAIVAALYVSIVASIMYYGPQSTGPVNSVLVPIAMLSLFVLSAAIMGYLFLYQPALLFIDGKRKEGVTLFLHTVATFAGITILLLSALLVIS